MWLAGCVALWLCGWLVYYVAGWQCGWPVLRLANYIAASYVTGG